MDALPFILAFAGLTIGVIGYLGLAERLPRNNIAGVRTRSTMRSDTAFRVANKAAGVPTMAAGGVTLAGAVAAWLLPTQESVITAVLVAMVGTLALAIMGAVMGVRAVKARSDKEPGSPAE